ncbi:MULTISPECIES: LysR family transcriptional regulator [unclassified Pseudoalteromonas]|uniref:LysR family transcriptional regulator n=1 Tax=unclassified Pseudoalteromonas TaxID=194690 RepID=UPI000B3D4557|nr:MULTISPECIES: LysR family transcriptional regulator [unclassified Pseudoalteromonas]MDN3377242.1 LysR family transcriptional regulator [Pseudoalteromonas sp. APC 3893]MDN3385590.1 LysR family transcriptional regulator [Pseudoalteromonas sp. APC 4017]OUS73274.1 LysR family transcriptional regulator [Pseudoalteromonas sp. A601]
MQLDDLKLILKVAEFKSITLAAAKLDMRTATASAAIKRVEAALGVDLFVRTTRHLRLSAAGERYIPQCEQALVVLENARQNLKGEHDEIEGELRVALSSDLGRNLVIPWIDEIMDKYPKVSLRAHISDSNIDFYRDSVDIALRYGSPSDTNVYGFKICNVPRLLCATKEYVQQHGNPQHPDELSQHQGLFYQLQDIINNVWEFTDGDTKYKVKMQGKRASNDGDLVRRWCVAGKGIAVKSALDIADDLLNERVITLMPGYQHTCGELWLICPSRQSITPAVRLLRDACREKATRLLQQLVDKGVLAKSALE